MQRYVVVLLLLLALPAWAGVPIPELASELNNDPAGLGYSADIASGSDNGLLEKINVVRAGAPYSIQRKNIPVSEFVTGFDPTEYLALAQDKLAQLNPMLAGVQLDVSAQSVRTILASIFPAGGPTRTNLQAIVKRQGSRAEVLWGIETRVTEAEISCALRGQGCL